MAETLSIELVTPLGMYEGEGIEQVLIPAASGEMGVMPGHDVMIVSLGTGPLRVQYADRTESFFVNRGYAEVESSKVIVLAETFEEQSQIDVERAEAARDRAEERLNHKSDEDLDWKRAESALKRAIGRLDVAGS